MIYPSAPVEPAPIEPEVETFRDTADITEVKTEGTIFLLTSQFIFC